jgi:hypothetical protein
VDPAVLPPTRVEVRQEDGAEKPKIVLSAGTSPIRTFTIHDLATGNLVQESAKDDADTTNLTTYSAVCYAHYPVPTLGVQVTAADTKKGASASGNANSATGTGDGAETKAAFKGFDEAKLPELAKFVHGKKDGIDKLVLAFHALYPAFSKLQIQKRIKEIADKAKHVDGYGTARFMVKPEILEKLQIKVSMCTCVSGAMHVD